MTRGLRRRLAASGTRRGAPARALTDFVGIAIHCAQGAALCDTPNAKPDDSTTFPAVRQRLQGALRRQVRQPGDHRRPTGCVKATDGTNITDPLGNCGFPGFDGALAKNTLGEVAQMQENGVPVSFAYISDAHDFHCRRSRLVRTPRAARARPTTRLS